LTAVGAGSGGNVDGAVGQLGNGNGGQGVGNVITGPAATVVGLGTANGVVAGKHIQCVVLFSL
jgi:hypothetical protein